MTLLFGLGLLILAGSILLFLPGGSLPQLFADLAVTAFGAGLGVFLAFHVREQRSQRLEQQRQGQQEARLAEMLDAVREEIEPLTDAAETLEYRIAGGRPIYEALHLSSATWSSHRDRILTLEDRPSVRRDLVEFYDHVAALRRLVHLYQRSWGIAIQPSDIETSLGEVRAAREESRHPGGEHARGLVVKEMKGKAETVVELGSELLHEWEERISRLQGKPAGREAQRKDHSRKTGRISPAMPDDGDLPTHRNPACQTNRDPSGIRIDGSSPAVTSVGLRGDESLWSKVLAC